MRRRKPINYVAAIAVSCLIVPVTLTDSLCLPGGIILPVGTVLPAGAMLPDKFVKHFNMAAQNGMGVALGSPARLLEPDTVMADQSNSSDLSESSESSESSDSDCSESGSESNEGDIRRMIMDAVEAKLRATQDASWSLVLRGYYTKPPPRPQSAREERPGPERVGHRVSAIRVPVRKGWIPGGPAFDEPRNLRYGFLHLDWAGLSVMSTGRRTRNLGGYGAGGRSGAWESVGGAGEEPVEGYIRSRSLLIVIITNGGILWE
ncbi:hypothetical protein QBC44DRAFT_313803 [Cladorrhinum sp. PSN332]|nr:hypothetical protein QBC44DRAFT_313803 [Cladorrhinum sp. PSN332]